MIAQEVESFVLACDQRQTLGRIQEFAVACNVAEDPLEGMKFLEPNFTDPMTRHSHI